MLVLQVKNNFHVLMMPVKAVVFILLLAICGSIVDIFEDVISKYFCDCSLSVC